MPRTLFPHTPLRVLLFALFFAPLHPYQTLVSYGSIPHNMTHLFILFRHGHRAPLASFPKDSNVNYSWPMGLGGLTTEGRRSMHTLGKFLRLRYGSFLGIDPRVVYARSGPEERCYDSLALVLYGLFPATGPWKDWMPDQDWQPVPIVRLPKDHDRFTQVCMRAFGRSVRSLPELPARGSFAKARDFLNFLAKNTGLRSSDPVGLLTAIDTLVVQYGNGLPVPEWALDNWDAIQWANDILIGHVAQSQTLNTGGTILREIADHLEKSVEKKTEQPVAAPKTASKVRKTVTLFSYNDINVYGVLRGLNSSYQTRPHYGTAILFEVYNKNGMPYVNILHKAERDPRLYAIDGGPNPIPVRSFITLVRSRFRAVSNKECEWTGLQLL